MSTNSENYQETHSSEGSQDLNGEGASFRGARTISEPGTVLKRRVRGALVPMAKPQ